MLEWVNRRWPNLRHALLRPFIVRISPDTVTILALMTAIIAGVALWQHLFLAAAALILLNGFFDILDGEIASKYGASRRGDLLDHTVDRLADIVIIIGVIAGGLVDITIGAAAIVLVLLVSYIGTEAQALTRKRLYVGLLGRADRLVLIAIGAAAEIFWAASLSLIMVLIILLSAVTFGQRFAKLWAMLR